MRDWREKYGITQQGQRGGWVYVLGDGDAIKVGVTRTEVDERVATLQVGNPRTLKVLWYTWVEEPYKLEWKIHRWLDAKRIHGEWFQATLDEVHECVYAPQRIARETVA